MFHIIVIKGSEEKKLGKASNFDELLKLLDKKDIKSIFEHDAYNDMKEVFETAKKLKGQDIFFQDINGINVDFISNGFEITTLVFYF